MQSIEIKMNQLLNKNPKLLQKINHQNNFHPLSRDFTKEPIEEKKC